MNRIYCIPVWGSLYLTIELGTGFGLYVQSIATVYPAAFMQDGEEVGIIMYRRGVLVSFPFVKLGVETIDALVE